MYKTLSEAYKNTKSGGVIVLLSDGWYSLKGFILFQVKFMMWLNVFLKRLGYNYYIKITKN